MKMTPEDEERLRLWHATENTDGIQNTAFPLLSYQGMKEYFETEICAFVRSHEYTGLALHSRKAGIQPTTPAWLRDTYAFVYYLNEEGEAKQFIQVWLRDQSIRSYSQISYIPGRATPSEFPAVPAFKAEAEPSVPRAEQDSIMRGVHRYLKNLFPKKVQREYYEAILANIVQNPGEIPRVCLVLEGQQGCGKNIFLSFFAQKVLGMQHCSQASSLSIVFDSHSTHLKLKSLVVVDEVNSNEGRKFADLFKDAVTTDYVNVNEKYQKQLQVPNMTSWIVTTNNRSSMLVEPGDRRFCFLDCSDKMCGPEKYNYWLEIANLLFHTPKTGRAVYQYFKGLDISEYRGMFPRKRPISYTHEAAAQCGIPDYSKYLSYMCGAMEMRCEKHTKVQAMGMVSDFKQWLADLNFSSQQQDRNTGPMFLAEMKSMCSEAANSENHMRACRYRRHTQGYCFSFEVKSLKEFLKQSKRFHQDLYEMGGGKEDMQGLQIRVEED